MTKCIWCVCGNAWVPWMWLEGFEIYKTTVKPLRLNTISSGRLARIQFVQFQDDANATWQFVWSAGMWHQRSLSSVVRVVSEPSHFCFQFDDCLSRLGNWEQIHLRNAKRWHAKLNRCPGENGFEAHQHIKVGGEGVLMELFWKLTSPRSHTNGWRATCAFIRFWWRTCTTVCLSTAFEDGWGADRSFIQFRPPRSSLYAHSICAFRRTDAPPPSFIISFYFTYLFISLFCTYACVTYITLQFF